MKKSEKLYMIGLVFILSMMVLGVIGRLFNFISGTNLLIRLVVLLCYFNLGFKFVPNWQNVIIEWNEKEK